MNKTDKDFLIRLLPDHYTCRFRETGINCQSETGIDENDREQWDYTLKAIRQYFGERFLEVNHTTCTDHKNFTVYLKMAENEHELRMEAAKQMAAKSVLSGVGGGELCNENGVLLLHDVTNSVKNACENCKHCELYENENWKPSDTYYCRLDDEKITDISQHYCDNFE